MRIQITVNEQSHSLEVHSDEMLIDLLRDRLNLKGVKRGCDSGQCGACTIILNGKAVYSCVMLACEVDGAVITTIEGLEQSGAAHPLQKAFVDAGAVQCGFCTPGMILSAKALLDEKPHPTEAEIRTAISGNLCRCTGYEKIVSAIQNAANGGGRDNG